MEHMAEHVIPDVIHAEILPDIVIRIAIIRAEIIGSTGNKILALVPALNGNIPPFEISSRAWLQV